MHQQVRDYIMDTLWNLVSNHGEFNVSPIDVREAVKNLKKGKSVGFDSLSSEHYVYASDLFNCIIVRGFLPHKLMETLLIPIVKDK